MCTRLGHEREKNKTNAHERTQHFSNANAPNPKFFEPNPNAPNFLRTFSNPPKKLGMFFFALLCIASGECLIFKLLFFCAHENAGMIPVNITKQVNYIPKTVVLVLWIDYYASHVTNITEYLYYLFEYFTPSFVDTFVDMLLLFVSQAFKIC